MKSRNTVGIQHDEASSRSKLSPRRKFGPKFVPATAVILGMTMLLGASAFAAEKGSMRLNDPVTVSGQTLTPGNYKVEWTGGGPDVELSILQGKRVVAKVPAHAVQWHMAANADAALTKKDNSGANTLIGLQFQGKKTSLELDEAGGAAAGSGQSQE